MMTEIFTYQTLKRLLMIVLSATMLFGCSSNTDMDSKSDYLPSRWSAAKVVSLCDSSDQDMASQDVVMEYDGDAYYNRKVTRDDHEIIVSFDFISECCQEFDITHQLTEEKLLILYKAKNGDYCDCKCDYRGTVNIGDKEIDFKEVKRITIKEAS